MLTEVPWLQAVAKQYRLLFYHVRLRFYTLLGSTYLLAIIRRRKYSYRNIKIEVGVAATRLIYIPEEFGSNPGPDTVYPD
jgi:hypothetical protein